jgi:hypothetical protein
LTEKIHGASFFAGSSNHSSLALKDGMTRRLRPRACAWPDTPGQAIYADLSRPASFPA